jgi:hypothetical protein
MPFYLLSLSPLALLHYRHNSFMGLRHLSRIHSKLDFSHAIHGTHHPIVVAGMHKGGIEDAGSEHLCWDSDGVDVETANWQL